mmetsp:Transcript_41132/g.124236  ORF Transcript_41132/g.124236 Transcript_41132/m.124236 type:complete len:261 (-) Transcript_41132:213-995(-)
MPLFSAATASASFASCSFDLASRATATPLSAPSAFEPSPSAPASDSSLHLSSGSSSLPLPVLLVGYTTFLTLEHRPVHFPPYIILICSISSRPNRGGSTAGAFFLSFFDLPLPLPLFLSPFSSEAVSTSPAASSFFLVLSPLLPPSSSSFGSLSPPSSSSLEPFPFFFPSSSLPSLSLSESPYRAKYSDLSSGGRVANAYSRHVLALTFAADAADGVAAHPSDSSSPFAPLTPQSFLSPSPAVPLATTGAFFLYLTPPPT